MVSFRRVIEFPWVMDGLFHGGRSRTKVAVESLLGMRKEKNELWVIGFIVWIIDKDNAPFSSDKK